MSYINVLIDSQGTANDFKSQSNLAPGQLDAMNNFIDYLGGICGGNMLGAVFNFSVGAVQATASFTVATGGSTNGQIGTLLNEDLTAVTSGADPEAGEFNISATAATQAASMVTAINTVLAGKVLATSNLGVVTITSLVPGEVGNGLQIDEGNLANVTSSAFTGGAEGTQYVLDFE